MLPAGVVPDGYAIPFSFYDRFMSAGGFYETQYIRRSTLTQDAAPVLSAEQIAVLTQALETIQARFKVVYGKQDDPGFAMDVEFKFGAGGGLVVKQARPWVE